MPNKVVGSRQTSKLNWATSLSQVFSTNHSRAERLNVKCGNKLKLTVDSKLVMEGLNVELEKKTIEKRLQQLE